MQLAMAGDAPRAARRHSAISLPPPSGLPESCRRVVEPRFVGVASPLGKGQGWVSERVCVSERGGGREGVLRPVGAALCVSPPPPAHSRSQPSPLLEQLCLRRLPLPPNARRCVDHGGEGQGRGGESEEGRVEKRAWDRLPVWTVMVRVGASVFNHDDRGGTHRRLHPLPRLLTTPTLVFSPPPLSPPDCTGTTQASLPPEKYKRKQD